MLLGQCSDSLSSCKYKLEPLWTASLRDSPLAATPTFFDVDGDGYGDIVAPSFSGEVWSVHGESGHIVDNWPFYLEERAFHSSPLVVSHAPYIVYRSFTSSPDTNRTEESVRISEGFLV